MTVPGVPAGSSRRTLALCLGIVGLCSAGYEALFLTHGINPLDEGWPLYAARSLLEGGKLYDDVLWVFPPGHLLAGLLGSWLAPPGLLLARAVYAAFAVAASLGVVLLAARVMAWPWVLLAGLLTAFAAPDSHMLHAVFGYRYMAFSMFALLCFARRADSGDARWLVAAGALLGTGACFRLGPSFAAGCGVGLAIASLSRSPARWLRDWAALALGLAATLGVAVLWLGTGVGVETLWREVVIRPATMLAEQSLSWPEEPFPVAWDRGLIRGWFIAVQFRLLLVLELGYVVWIAFAWLRSLRAKRPFEHALLLAIVVWSAVFFLRSLTRSDVAHLDSVLPPAFLLLAHAVGAGVDRLLASRPLSLRLPLQLLSAAVVLALWMGLLSTDLYFTHERRGVHPLASTGGRIHVAGLHQARLIDATVETLRRAEPGPLLDLTASPMLFVLSGRRGYGSSDVVMPGTFLVPEEELAFLERVEAAPPPLVVWPLLPFDSIPGRDPETYAPRVDAFVHQHYARVGRPRRWFVMRPDDSAEQRARQREGTRKAQRIFLDMTAEELERHRERE